MLNDLADHDISLWALGMSSASIADGDQCGDLPLPDRVCAAGSAGVPGRLAEGPLLASLGEGHAFAPRSAGIRAASRSS